MVGKSIKSKSKSRRPPGRISAWTRFANSTLASQACRFLPAQAEATSDAMLFRTSTILGGKATLTSPTFNPSAAAVAVTTATGALLVMGVGTLLIVVVSTRSVKYSVFTPIH